MKTEIFNDGILEATLYPSKWVFCRWVDNKHGRLQKRLIKDLNDIERYIYSKKLHGWFTDSEINHSNFHKLLIKFGCLPREVIGQYQRFMKPIRNVGDLHQKVGEHHVRICA
jgi:hypothetical protein